MEIIQIVGAVLKEDADGFALSFADQSRVGVPTANIREASYLREDLPKIIRTLPGRRESADPARTHPANRMQVRIIRNLQIKLLHRVRNQLIDQNRT